MRRLFLDRSVNICQCQTEPVPRSLEKTLEYMSLFGWQHVRGSYWCRSDMRAPPPALADSSLLTIAIQNLLINAAQAQQGRGRIVATLDSDGSMVSIAIADTGPGIPAEIRANLFRPFKTTKARGTGLGMATAKRLTESQGGQIEVVSPAGGGTTVTLLVPAAPADEV